MAYNEQLANRIREKLMDLPHVEEKKMMGGLVFMVNEKMCVGILKDEMMCRIDPVFQEALLEKNGCREMDFTKRPMKGYVLVADEGMRTDQEFDHWIGLCLAFNKFAKAARKKQK
ncbi:TfoX/Sxy family protein [Hufsiella ginkgonis]|uniref:RNA methyltransferase n=1 Tax=Hufsiella ginkgonis TaxID=2695274 RepID=A0A7K1XXR7_9SPHI|nr:TfoX/Sxy family protein [Hufsiella ginkgonis]MXV15801.1 RNA methyltransferase [Hufsiella ginkgonis]